MDTKTEIFEATRARLMGLAYRLLGSVSDAQDAVQDTYVKWISYQGPPKETPAAWLARVCTNHCLDRLKSAEKTRLDYVGPWIPDQIQLDSDASPEERLEIASSLTTAFLLLLERLTPKERAAYLLHDIFDIPFDEVGGILGLRPANCRQLAARARKFVTQTNVRHVPDETRQAELLATFQEALQTGSTKELSRALCQDANLRADSGGKAVASLTVIEGPSEICAFVADVLHPAWTGMQVSVTSVNGTLGLMVVNGAAIHASVSFSHGRDGSLHNIYVMRHPAKLERYQRTRGVGAKNGALRLI